MKMAPSEIMAYTRQLKEDLSILITLKDKEKIVSQREKIDKIICKISKEEITNNYCKNVTEILDLYVVEPSEENGNNSLLRLLSNNQQLLDKLIWELHLCSEPDDC